ncbi:MAG TPA: ABC transporter permease [Gammaproteobacteria bacterium]|nr:ABC transporter permease [Gammaproteobacteria bacterium]
MTTVLGRRVVQLIPVLLGVTVLSYLLLNLLPGNVAVTILGPNASAQAIAKLTREMGLNQPVYLRYLHWLWHALHGNLGYSYVTNQSVTAAIVQSLPVTLEIIFSAQVVGIICALPFALVAARNPNGLVDSSLSALAYSTVAVPRFLLGMILILLLAAYWHLFPATGFTPLTQGVVANLRSVALPVMSMAALEFALYFRVLRSDIVEQLAGEEYVVTAAAKGAGRGRVLVRHVLRNALLSVVTVMGLNFGPLISGAVVIEVLFALPGIGHLLINSILGRDVVMVQGIVVFVASAVVFINLLVDIIYTLLDPRIRYNA